MDRSHVRSAIVPLRVVFYASLICVLDFSLSETVSINGDVSGWRFDVLNDAVGMVLMTWATYRLSRIQVHNRYARMMGFIVVVALVGIVDAIHEHFIYSVPPAIGVAQSLYGLVSLGAVIGFCVAMRWMCVEAGLTGAAQSWRVTSLLFLVIYVLPLGFMQAVGTVAYFTEVPPFHLDLGSAMLLVLIVFLVPPIHLFVSTSRMHRAAQAVTA